jgi:hypothetical protein
VPQRAVLQVLARFIANEQFDKTVETGVECGAERSSVQLGRNV